MERGTPGAFLDHRERSRRPHAEDVRFIHHAMTTRPEEAPAAVECGHEGHAPRPATKAAYGDDSFARAASLFRAAGDEPRLRLIELLGRGERCVSELAAATGAKLSTLSQQLKILRGERIVVHRRDGKHIYYKLADDHVLMLVTAALEHATEPHADSRSAPGTG